jgi:hypothetical protein
MRLVGVGAQEAPRAKRTPKMNSLYNSDDLLVGNDIKLPPAELLPETGTVERRVRPVRDPVTQRACAVMQEGVPC